MDERIARTLNNINDFDHLATFEGNVLRQKAMNPEVAQAFKVRASELARNLVATRTGLDLNHLTPAEARIVEAVSEYVGVMKRKGKDATRTLSQLRNRGLIESAETAVSKSQPTQGYQVLKEEDREDISYEQIILDHPDEFSDRAAWYARRTLDIPNDSDKAPAKGLSPTQTRTEQLLKWLADRAASQSGGLGSFSNSDAAAAIGLVDMERHGRVFGNIISRLDFACYRLGLPPLGLTAREPFANAWQAEDRDWEFPVASMQRAAKGFRWQSHDFDRVLRGTQALPGQAHISWKKEISEHADAVRKWAYELENQPHQSVAESPPLRTTSSSNPDWTREEHILALDLYLRLRKSGYDDSHEDVIELSENLRVLAGIRGMSGSATFRNPNGVSMKLTNFSRIDPEYTADGRVGLSRGSKTEEEVWRDFASAPDLLTEAVETILAEIEDKRTDQVSLDEDKITHDDGTHWVFICNPSKWAIDRFLATDVEVDSWGVKESDKHKFAPGQLAVVRVGLDRRSEIARQGEPALEPGIYALCEVLSEAFPGSGAADEYWAKDAIPEVGRPTVRIRYLRKYLKNPLTVDRIVSVYPHIARVIQKGFQARSFNLPGVDFRAIMGLLGEDTEALPLPPIPAVDSLSELAALETKYAKASPEVKSRVSKYVERGPIGATVKKANGYKCQMCEALGRDPLGFKKKSGDPYIEAHHVMPVSEKQAGSLSATNIVTLCANHHREVHYGEVSVKIEASCFEFSIGGTTVRIPKIEIDRLPILTDGKAAE